MEQGWSWDFRSRGQSVPRLQTTPPGPGSASSRAEAQRLLSPQVRRCDSPKPFVLKIAQNPRHIWFGGPNHYKHCGETSSPFLLVWEVPQGLHICTG